MEHLRRPSATDVLVALGTGAASLAAFFAAPLILGESHEQTLNGAAWWPTALVLAGQALVLCLARSAPRTVLLVTAGAAMMLGLLSPTGIGNLADAAVLVAVIRTALLIPAGHLRWVLPTAGVFVAVGQAADVLGSSALPILAAIGAAVLQAIAIVGLPSVGLLAMSATRDARRARRGESAAMLREQEALVQAAVARERTAMARELHDIAAHHVSSIALMAAAVERQISAHPEEAKLAVRQIRSQSRVLLDDLRQLVGLLRRDDAPETAESLGSVPDLVETARATGRTVELRVTPGDRELGPLGQLVVYRMVQEALANAARYAPSAACLVDLDGGQPRAFVVTVRNEPADSPAAPSREGFGLVGMRERAVLIGGTLHAGADPDGGWTVRLRIPHESDAACRGELP